MYLRLLFCAGALAAGASAADLPELTLSAGLGVNIHFTRDHARDLDLIAAAGARLVRMDLHWEETERARGVYNWSNYDALLTDLDRRGLRALLILDYSNRLYESPATAPDREAGKAKTETATPQRPESVAAFARWAAAAARHYQGRKVIWEIWNEPNITVWPPQPEAKPYAALALATAKAIRAADPTATIIGPAASEVPWNFLEELFQAGLLAELDGISVHPYRPGPPESVGDDYVKLRALIERHLGPTQAAPAVISGEWGYSSYRRGVSLDQQAEFAVRQQLVNLYHRVPLSIWYDWKNDGPSAEEREHNFGTVYPDLSAKPAYTALQTLTQELAGYRLARRLEAGADDIWVLLLVDDAGHQKLAVWSVYTPRDVTLPLPSLGTSPIAARDGSGHPILQVNAGALKFRASTLPQYITVQSPCPELATAAAWRIRDRPATFVPAGEPAAVRFKLLLQNPLSKSVRVRIGLEGLAAEENPSPELTIPPGVVTEYPVRATLYQRGEEIVSTAVRVEYRFADEPVNAVPISRTSETLAFVVRNPLTLDLVPIESGLNVRVRNPGATPLQGRLQSGPDETTEISLVSGGEANQAVHAALRTPVRLLDADGHVMAQAHRQFTPVTFSSLITSIDGDASVAGQAKAQRAPQPPAGAPFKEVWQLDYRFGSGWRFANCMPRDSTGPGGRAPIVPGRPAAMGLWIYGNRSGDALRMRLADATGQIFQLSAGNLDWPTWRWVQFDLTAIESVPHWGGANDGIVHGELFLDTLLVIDSTRREHVDTVYIAGPHWIAAPTAEP